MVIVTNQAGISRGYYGWDAFTAVQQKMLDDLAATGAWIDTVSACPYHPGADGVSLAAVEDYENAFKLMRRGIRIPRRFREIGHRKRG